MCVDYSPGAGTLLLGVVSPRPLRIWVIEVC